MDCLSIRPHGKQWKKDLQWVSTWNKKKVESVSNYWNLFDLLWCVQFWAMFLLCIARFPLFLAVGHSLCISNDVSHTVCQLPKTEHAGVHRLAQRNFSSTSWGSNLCPLDYKAASVTRWPCFSVVPARSGRVILKTSTTRTRWSDPWWPALPCGKMNPTWRRLKPKSRLSPIKMSGWPPQRKDKIPANSNKGPGQT